MHSLVHLSSRQAWQLDQRECLHPQGHIRTAAVLRPAIKETQSARPMSIREVIFQNSPPPPTDCSVPAVEKHCSSDMGFARMKITHITISNQIQNRNLYSIIRYLLLADNSKSIGS
jgi:hypothetical protein